MGYEKVTDLSTDTVYKLGGVDSKTGKKNPTNMEGYYLGSRTVKSENGTSTIHVFQTPKGNEGIWGSADTNSKLANVALGTMTNVVFKAKVKIGGGKTKNVFDVFVDKENTIEVSGAAANTAQEESYSDADENYVADTEETTDDGQADEAAAEAALLAAERAAKVKALLGKNKKV